MDNPPQECIAWIKALFGECVTTQQQAWSLLLGYMSIFCWLNAQIPQIIENFKLGSAASLSLPFLVNWLLGDISNLIGCILTHQLPFQMYLAIYFCIADIILFGQWVYYSRRERRRTSIPEIMVATLPETSEWDTSDRIASTSAPPSTYPHDEPDLETSETVSPLLQRPRPRRATTTSDIAHRRSTSIVLFGVILLAMRETLPSLQESRPSPSWDQLGSGAGAMGRVFARALGDDAPSESAPPSDPNAVQLGRIFAWVCTVFYLSSRMPQLWKNFNRKSVQGLSILMFFWAAMGNLTYTLSILNSADAVNPETSKKFLREAVPYVLGSSGTLMFDVSIFGQWLYYSGVLGRKRSRRARHHHHRQRGSHSHPRLDSMALSPSNSQSGLYNILVDEEEDPSLVNDPGQNPLSLPTPASPFQAPSH